MFDFFDGVETKQGGGKKFPECKGYVWVVTKVIAEKSKKGRPMVRLEFDIAEGEFTGFFSEYNKRLYCVLGNEDGSFDKDMLGKFKGIIQTIVDENKGMFPEEDVFAGGKFEETRLIGCTVGGVLKWDEAGKYTDFHYVCSKEEALEKEAIPRPEQTVAEQFTVPEDGGTKKSLFG